MNNLILAALIFVLTPQEDAAISEFERQQKQIKPIEIIQVDTMNYETDKVKTFILIDNRVVDSMQLVSDSLKICFLRIKEMGKTKKYNLNDKIRYFDYLLKYTLLDTQRVFMAIEITMNIYTIELNKMQVIMETQQGNTKAEIMNLFRMKKIELNKISSYYLYRIKEKCLK
jgi:hypothetical protein